MLSIEAHRTVIGLFCSRRIKKSRCLIKKSYKKDKNLAEWTCFFKVLVLTYVLLFNLAINLYYKCVKASQPTRVGIESNPGQSKKNCLFPSPRPGENFFVEIRAAIFILFDRLFEKFSSGQYLLMYNIVFFSRKNSVCVGICYVFAVIFSNTPCS